MEAPDYAEPIVGMRSWRYSDRVLRPVNNVDRWKRFMREPCSEHFLDTAHRLMEWAPGVALGSVCSAQTICEAPRLEPITVADTNFAFPYRRYDCVGKHAGQEAPVLDCSCGFYATTDVQRLPIPNPDDYRREWVVVGQVVMWGKLIEHELGWRAQYAYPGRVFVMGYQTKGFGGLGAFPSYGHGYGGVAERRVLDEAARALSADYGILARAVTDLTLYGLYDHGLVDEHGKLKDRAIPRPSEQIVRPWEYEPEQAICTHCGRATYDCRGRYYDGFCDRSWTDSWT